MNGARAEPCANTSSRRREKRRLVEFRAGLGIPQEDYLVTLARLSKYSLGTRRQGGLAVSDDGDGFFVLWAYADEAHAPDPDLDAALAAPGNPLPLTREQVVPRYHFDSDGLERLLGPEPE